MRRKVERDRNGLIIVDSAAYACGGDPKDAEVALRYFNALNSIGKTSLTVAHVPKDSDQDKPFGSVYWSNSARKTWNFQRAQDEGEDVIHIGLFNKKVNNGRRDKPIGIRLMFEGETGPVTVKREDVGDVPELDRSRPLRQRIVDALKRQAKQTVDETADELDASPDSVRRLINRDLRSFLAREGEDKVARWSLLSKRES